MAENQIDDIADVFEEIMGDDFDEPAISAKNAGDHIVHVNVALVERVMGGIKSDALLPDHFRTLLDSTTADQLIPALKLLDPIFKSEIFSSSAKEKAWHNYHLLQPLLIDEIFKIVKNRQLSALISLKTAEEIMKKNSDPFQSSLNSNELRSGERDIVAYIAGFVLFRCKKKFSSFPEIEKCLEKLVDKDGATKLISVKSRGGLTQPSSEIIAFFVILELVFRNLCSSMSVPLLQKFTDSICSESKAVSIFYDCTYHSDSKSEVQEKLFFTILSTYHKVRCHAKCRQMMERFYLKTKTSSKQKALRKCID